MSNIFYCYITSRSINRFILFVNVVDDDISASISRIKTTFKDFIHYVIESLAKRLSSSHMEYFTYVLFYPGLNIYSHFSFSCNNGEIHVNSILSQLVKKRQWPHG